MRDIAAFEACFESQRQAWRASADGLMVDAEIYAQPWGFPSRKSRCRFASGMAKRIAAFTGNWRAR